MIDLHAAQVDQPNRLTNRSGGEFDQSVGVAGHLEPRTGDRRGQIVASKRCAGQLAAPRPDGRQEPRRLMRDHQDQSINGRFLDWFQQSVCRGRVQIIGGVDNNNTRTAISCREVKEILKTARFGRG